MTAPTLLKIDSTHTIPSSVFDDLQVTKILPPTAVSVLSHPCSADVIKKRQALFSLLDDDAYLETFRSFYEGIRTLSRRDMMCRKAETSIEKAFGSAELLRQYISVCRIIPALRGCELTDALADYWSGTERKESLAAAERALSEADVYLRRISRFDISFHIKSWVTPDTGAPSYIDLIRENAESLGFDVNVRAARSVPDENGPAPDSSLGDAAGTLFEADIASALGLLNAHTPSELDALERYYDEAMFYLDIHDFIARARLKNIPTCVPKISPSRRYDARRAYDVTLLAKCIGEIVPNDIGFSSGKAFYFLVGANGGGKTTYLRCVGVNLLLFLGGAPIFARGAEIFPFRDVRTHFPVDERISDGGRLDDERRRVTEMLDRAGDESFLLFNETYSGTNDEYGSALALRTASVMKERELFGIFVTHFHETEREDFNFLEVVVDGEDENRRTYKVMPKKTRSGSYAADILKKYGLDRESLEGRSRKNDITSART